MSSTPKQSASRQSLCLGTLLAFSLSTVAADPLQTAILDLHAKSAGLAPMRDAASSFQPAFELRALKDDSAVSLRWGTPLENKDQFIAFTASAPLDENNVNTTLMDLDGLSHAVTFEAKYNWFWGDKREESRSKAAGLGRGAAETLGRAAWIEQRLGQRLEDEPAGKGRLDLAARDTRAKAVRDAVAKTAKKTTLLSFSGKMGYQSFDYLEPSTLDDKSAEKKMYSGRVAWSEYVWNDSAVAFEFEYQDAFKAADEKSFALPAGTNGFQEVKTGAFGPPTPKLKRLYSLEYRQRGLLFTDKGSFSIRFTYDQVKDIYGVRVPIYFIENADGVATGGVEVGWTGHHDKNKDRLTVTLMIGAGTKLVPFAK